MTGSGAASGRRGPLVLVVLDGWGLREQREGNAIKLARTPNYLELLDRFPHSSLQASGEEVGLPAGQGETPKSATHDGAGGSSTRLTRIDKTSGRRFSRSGVRRSDDARSGPNALTYRLVSDAYKPHAHLYALVEMARASSAPPVREASHGAIATREALDSRRSRQRMAKHGSGRVGRWATALGMDRDKQWSARSAPRRHPWRGTGRDRPLRATLAVSHPESYESGVARVRPDGHIVAPAPAIGPVRDGTSHLFHFRSDRARQLSRALTFDDFNGSSGPRVHVSMTTMTDDRTFTFLASRRSRDVFAR